MNIEQMDYNPDNEHQPGVAELEILFAPVDEFLTIGEIPKLNTDPTFEAAGTIAAADTHFASISALGTPISIIK